MLRRGAGWTNIQGLGAACVLALVLVGCSDDGGGSFSKGGDLAVAVDPNPINFGTVASGQHAERIVTVRHIGTNGTLSLRSVRVVSESVEFSVGKPSKSALEAGEAAELVLSYDPVDLVQDQGELVIETNAPGQAGGSLTMRVPILTGAQGALLAVLPSPVRFDGVAVGEQQERQVTLANLGTEPMEITGVSIQQGEDGEPFSVVAGPTWPQTVAASGSVTLTLGYRPERFGASQGAMVVRMTVGGRASESAPTALLGGGVGPELVAFPNPVDFGWRALGATHRIPLTLSNEGSLPLVVSGVSLKAGSSDTVGWEGLTPGGDTVAAGGMLPLQVTFTPRTDLVQTSGPIATLVIASNDGASGGTTEIQVFGRSQVPLLQVNPSDSVIFGFVAQNYTNQRTVSLFNAGAAPLTVDAVTLPDAAQGEYELVPDGWGPTATVPTPATLLPNEYRELRVKFTNRGGTSGVQWGKLRIASNDPGRPEWDLDLKAERAGAPVCDLRLVPGQLDFGTVARGNQRVMTVNLVNAGSGDCSFHSALVNGCSSFFGVFGGACADPNTTQQLGGTSPYYRVTRTPLALRGGLKAGQSYPLEVTFTPPDSAPIFGDELMDYAGLLAVRYQDPNSGSDDLKIVPRAQTGGTSAYPPNLHARSGIAQLAVLPGSVDFGLTTVGCASQVMEVTAYNVGSAPLDLTRIELTGCTPEFRVRSAPPLPKTLAQNGNERVTVQYVPQDTSSDACGLAFYTNNEASPAIVVPLRGQGTYLTSHTDTFTQTSGQNVDVLFVVDNSGSMSEEQSNLGSNFQSFIAAAQAWQNDFHIAVTTTDLENENGKFVSSQGNARFVTRATTAQFGSNVRVGTNGSADEKGLAAAQAALSLPNIADTGTACSADSQCTLPDRCIDGFCGGRNRGFLRADAALEVVVVSDEEDSSAGSIPFYVNFFKNIKGIYNANMFHFHAIVGPPGGCSSSAGDAVVGARYIDVAQQTGGAVVSICDASFASGLTSIGDIAFGLRSQFFLGRVPEASTITVKVANRTCAPGAGGVNWRYDANSNSVVFSEGGSCMPQAGQQVEIHYDTLCLLP